MTLGFALESFLLVLLRGNAKIDSKAVVPPAVFKALRVFMSRRYVTGIPSIFTVPKLSYVVDHSEVSQASGLPLSKTSKKDSRAKPRVTKKPTVLTSVVNLFTTR